MRLTSIAALIGFGLACTPPPEADLPYSEGLVAAYVAFDEEPEVLAPLLRNLERELYTNMIVDGGLGDRTLQPELLTRADIAHISPKPAESDPKNNIAVSMAYASPFAIKDHARLPLLEDQTQIEPQSPDHYDREWIDGKDCWQSRGCEWMHTFQELTKTYPLNIVPPIPYAFYKDYRWVDMNVGLDGATGERWAFIARSWNPEVYKSDNEAAVMHQSYTIELWIPRDGEGFLWDADAIAKYGEPEEEQGDSSGGGVLRSLTLWNETEVPIGGDPNTQLSVIPGGAQDNYIVQDEWLEEN